MIAMRLDDEKGGVCVMLVLEPGNLEKLKAGQPVHKWLNEFIPELPTKVELLFAYTPDPVWCAEQMQKRGINHDAIKIAEIIDESLSRKPVVIRDRTAEELKRVL
jgi:hypothetical protein